MKKLKKADITNFMIRAFFFFAFPSAWVAGFSGFKNLCEQIISGKPIEMNAFITALIVLLIFTIIFGRFFCGKACAFGTYGDVMHWIGRQMWKKSKKGEVIKLDVRMRYVKYFVLICAGLLCVSGLSAQLTAASPWTAFSNIRSLKLDLGTGLAAAGMLLFAVCSFGMMIEKRFFCRFICPFGAIFSILPVMPFSMVSRKRSDCIKGCKACRNACPAQLDIPYVDEESENDYQFSMGECFQCGRCAQICPEKNAGCATMPGGAFGIIFDIVKAVILAALMYYYN